MAHERAGTLAQPADLIDIAELVTAYYTRTPDADNPDPVSYTHLTLPTICSV